MSSLYSKETKNKIKELSGQGCRNPELIIKLLSADDYKDVMSALLEYLGLDEGRQSKLWMHIIHNQWEGVRNSDEIESVFDQHENIFFRELLKNRGTLARVQCIRDIFKTPHICNRVTKNLIEMELIDKIELRNREVVYHLNLNLYKKVFCEAINEER